MHVLLGDTQTASSQMHAPSESRSAGLEAEGAPICSHALSLFCRCVARLAEDVAASDASLRLHRQAADESERKEADAQADAARRELLDDRVAAALGAPANDEHRRRRHYRGEGSLLAVLRLRTAILLRRLLTVLLRLGVLLLLHRLALRRVHRLLLLLRWEEEKNTGQTRKSEPKVCAGVAKREAHAREVHACSCGC